MNNKIVIWKDEVQKIIGKDLQVKSFWKSF